MAYVTEFLLFFLLRIFFFVATNATVRPRAFASLVPTMAYKTVLSLQRHTVAVTH